MALKFFYTYRRYSYALAVLMVIASFVISHRLSVNTRRDLENRSAILPAPVYTEDPGDLKEVKVRTDGNRLYITYGGKGVLYMAEFADASNRSSFCYDRKPLEKGETGSMELPAGAETIELTGAGIDK